MRYAVFHINDSYSRYFVYNDTNRRECRYFNGDPHLFITKIKTIHIQISLYFFFNFTSSVFLKIEISAKSSFFHIYFIQKSYLRLIFWNRVPFTNQGEICFFYHINTLGIPWILQMQNFFLKIHGVNFSTRYQLGPY